VSDFHWLIEHFSKSKSLFFKFYAKQFARYFIIWKTECKNGLTVPGLKFFADMKDNLGVYLAMTGDFVKGEDCLRFGLVEYFVEDRFLEAL